MDIGFIGLGQMGSAMARNLMRAGHHLTVYNRTRAKAEALAQDGAKIAERPGDCCRGEAVITMLADDAALEAAVGGGDGALANLKTGAIHIATSTISPALAERLTAAHSELGQHHVAAGAGPAGGGRGGEIVHPRRRIRGSAGALQADLRRVGAAYIHRRRHALSGQSREARLQLPHRGDAGERRRGRGAGAQGRHRRASLHRDPDIPRCSRRRSTRPTARSSPTRSTSRPASRWRLG